MARLIKPDTLLVEWVKPANGRTFELAELQAFVGGYIEALRLGDEWVFMNEDGKRLGLRYNDLATSMLAGVLRWDDMVVGTVVVCTPLEAGAAE